MQLRTAQVYWAFRRVFDFPRQSDAIQPRIQGIAFVTDSSAVECLFSEFEHLVSESHPGLISLSFRSKLEESFGVIP